MGSNKVFSIPFEGLKFGKHEFEFEITDKFFEELAYSIIQKGDIKVSFLLDKKENMMVGEIEMSGKITKECDRCTDELDVPIDLTHQVVFKFSDEFSDDENLITLASNEFEINTVPIFYEILTVSLPTRNVHEENECNEEMLKLIDEYTGFTEEDDSDNDENDPRWDALKNLN
ncbi:MAG: YceD family protein [Brumimicrobium sp.]